MAEGIKPFNWTGNLSMITQEWSSGPQFKNPNLSPAMTIVPGLDPKVDEKLHAETPKESAVIDVWNMRRPNASA